MNKTLVIEGMMCSHCAGRVEKALNAISGVEAKVDLENKLARVEFSKDVSDEILREAVEKAGYKLTEIR